MTLEELQSLERGDVVEFNGAVLGLVTKRDEKGAYIQWDYEPVRGPNGPWVGPKDAASLMLVGRNWAARMKSK